MVEGEGLVKYMVRMDYGFSHIIQIMALYMPQLKTRLICSRVIETQEGNPVFFGVYVRWNRINPHCTI